MEAALLPDERTNFVSMSRLRHGWENQKQTNQWRDSDGSQKLILSAMIRLIFYGSFIEFLWK